MKRLKVGYSTKNESETEPPLVPPAQCYIFGHELEFCTPVLILTDQNKIPALKHVLDVDLISVFAWP